MKKIFCLLIAVLLCSVAMTAMAKMPGEQVTVSLSLDSNPDNAVFMGVRFSFDTTALEFVSASSNAGQAPDNANGTFVINNLNGIPTGTIGSITFLIKEGAPAGNYPVSVTVSYAYNANEENVSVSVSGGSVTVDKPCDEHTWGKGVVTQEANCTTEGKQDVTCTVCGYKTTLTIEKTPHIPGTPEVKKPTCTTDGSSVTKCKTCETVIEEKVLEKLGHEDGEEVIIVEATCTKDGSKEIKCATCGQTVRTEKIEKLGHDVVEDKAVEATCTKDGKTAGSHCKRCNEVIEEQKVVEKLGHDVVEDKAVEATCTKDGKTAGSHCARCKEVLVKQEVVPAAHKPSADAVRVEPTCTEDGSISYSCTVCGEKIESEKIPALGHDWDEGKVTTKATCEKDGEKTYTCKNDESHTKTEKIAKLGHDWDEGEVTTKATCEQDGEKTYTCKNDKSHTKTEKIAKLGHKWSKWVETKPATKEEDGEKQRTCENCGKVETAVINSMTTYHMTLCSEGIRFRDLENALTNDWYMFTPVDLSVDGVQTFNLIAGNISRVGTVEIAVEDGYVTITYILNNARETKITEEFVTLLPDINAVTELDFDALPAFTFGEKISIEEALGGDTKVLLFICNKAVYEQDIAGVELYAKDSEAYKLFVEELKLLMD